MSGNKIWCSTPGTLNLHVLNIYTQEIVHFKGCFPRIKLLQNERFSENGTKDTSYCNGNWILKCAISDTIYSERLISLEALKTHPRDIIGWNELRKYDD